ncbi:hypothetical protein [Nonomuraea lactucae]|uniref:hypothetical protein n=1 Tax=Nonomuraea lactucae TaxID=2249762 RepID=UPI000DE33863|nr:hypothetical protein [Nonomuraea lactucae]
MMVIQVKVMIAPYTAPQTTPARGAAGAKAAKQIAPAIVPATNPDDAAMSTWSHSAMFAWGASTTLAGTVIVRVEVAVEPEPTEVTAKRGGVPPQPSNVGCGVESSVTSIWCWENSARQSASLSNVLSWSWRNELSTAGSRLSALILITKSSPAACAGVVVAARPVANSAMAVISDGL